MDYYSSSYIVIEYTDNAQTMKMFLENSDVTLGKIADVFPEINEIETERFYYDSIEEIKGFDDLRSITVLNSYHDFTENEIEYILSLYPDCEIYNAEK